MHRGPAAHTHQPQTANPRRSARTDQTSAGSRRNNGGSRNRRSRPDYPAQNPNVAFLPDLTVAFHDLPVAVSVLPETE